MCIISNRCKSFAISPDRKKGIDVVKEEISHHMNGGTISIIGIGSLIIQMCHMQVPYELINTGSFGFGVTPDHEEITYSCHPSRHPDNVTRIVVDEINRIRQTLQTW